MSPFRRPLNLEYIDGRTWLVTEDFTYTRPTGWGIKVPAGFVTDFASVPRFFWRLLPPTGEYGKAAVVHDYLYRYGTVTRAEADRVFLEAMAELGVSRFTRKVMYRAVRLFGAAAYHRTIEPA